MSSLFWVKRRFLFFSFTTGILIMTVSWLLLFQPYQSSIVRTSLVETKVEDLGLPNFPINENDVATSSNYGEKIKSLQKPDDTIIPDKFKHILKKMTNILENSSHVWTEDEQKYINLIKQQLKIVPDTNHVSANTGGPNLNTHTSNTQKQRGTSNSISSHSNSPSKNMISHNDNSNPSQHENTNNNVPVDRPINKDNVINNENSDAGNPDNVINNGNSDAGNPDNVINNENSDAKNQDNVIENGNSDAGNPDNVINNRISDAENQDNVIKNGNPDADLQDNMMNNRNSDADNPENVINNGNSDAGNPYNVNNNGNSDAENQDNVINNGNSDADNQENVINNGNSDADNPDNVINNGNSDADNPYNANNNRISDADNPDNVINNGDSDADLQDNVINNGNSDADNPYNANNNRISDADNPDNVINNGDSDADLQDNVINNGISDAENQENVIKNGDSDADLQDNVINNGISDTDLQDNVIKNGNSDAGNNVIHEHIPNGQKVKNSVRKLSDISLTDLQNTWNKMKNSHKRSDLKTFNMRIPYIEPIPDEDDENLGTIRPDQCESCFSYNFPILINNPELCKNTKVHLLMLITTSPNHRKARVVIRKTWGARCRENNSEIKCLFVVGNTSDKAINTDLVTENKTYGDILQIDFKDAYGNLTYKTLTSLNWAARYCLHARYVMKTDDDMFVNMELIPKMLLAAPRVGFMGGFCWGPGHPIRDVKSKWYVSYRLFSKPKFPAMCSGTGYVLSMDTVRKVIVASHNIPFFYLEDVYVAFCVQKYGIMPIKILGFANNLQAYDPCLYRNAVMTSHRLTPKMLEEIWPEIHECPASNVSPEDLYIILPY